MDKIKKRSLIPIERVNETILLIRGQKVILDTDLAKLYGTTTKRLNEQVKRNRERFPEDFMFLLTREEKAEVVANCDHLPGMFVVYIKLCRYYFDIAPEATASYLPTYREIWNE